MIRRNATTMRRAVMVAAVMMMVAGVTQFLPWQTNVPKAQAAQITINGDLYASRAKYNASPQVAFVSDTTGYAFYVDETGDDVRYKKTTDGGASWGGEVDLSDDRDWGSIAIWYDQWTPNDTTGTKIYIAAQDQFPSGSDQLYFKILDTNGDTLSPSGTTWTQITSSSSDYGAGTNGQVSITKARSGHLFAVTALATALDVYRSTNGGSSWVTTSAGLDSSGDFNQLLPLGGGDILLLNQDISADKLRSKVFSYVNNAWDVSFTDVFTSYVENATYDGSYGAAVNKITGDVFVVGNNNPAVSGGDLLFGRFSNAARTWSQSSSGGGSLVDVYTNIGTSGLQGTVAVDQQNGDVYAFYLRGTVGSAMHVYYKKSTDGGASWGSEQGPISSSSGNYVQVYANMISPYKIYASWDDASNHILYGVNYSDTAALDIVETRMMVFWDGTPLTIPSGWQSVSQFTSDPFYQRFPRGNGAYSGSGGADTHSHTATIGTVTDNMTTVTGRSGTERAGSTHEHAWGGTVSSENSLPAYREIQLIQYTAGIPSTIPQNAIAFFDTSVPTGWTQYSAHDDKFVRVGPYNISPPTGGSNTAHSHTVTITDAQVIAQDEVGASGPSAARASASNHTHMSGGNSGTDTSDTDNHVPIHVEVVVGKKNADGAAPTGMIALFTGSPSAGWDVISASSETFYQRYLEAKTSYTANGSGGASSHNHNGSKTVVSNSTTGVNYDGEPFPPPPPDQSLAHNDHTHNVPVNIASLDNLPTYTDVVVAQALAYTPVSKNWRWFDAENVADPNTTNGGETTTADAMGDEDNDGTSTPPSNTRIVYKGNAVKLRVVVGETAGVGATDVKYKLQYDTNTNFLTAVDVDAQGGSTNVWRYYNGANVNDDDVIQNVRLTNNSPTAGRHNEDATTGVGAGSSFDPSGSTNYEHEFTIQSNPDKQPTANTTYYFRLRYMENSAAAGGVWVTVALNSGNSYPALKTATTYDLEMATAPTDVYLGTYTMGGGGTLSYPFEAGEEFVFWDKRGNSTTYNVVVSAMTIPKVGGGDTIPGSDITWISTTTMLNGSFASDKTDMAGQTGATLNADRDAYIASPGTEGKGGFYFLPTMELANLESRAIGDYEGTLTITVI